MKRTIFTVIAALIPLLLLLGVAGADDLERRTAESRAVVKEFAGSLKAALKGGMKAGGPLNAISACNVTAPAIAMDQSKRHGWRVARTSLKLRNPGNAPDDWETDVLRSFETRRAAGEDPAKLEHAEVVTADDGKKKFRYMKAIPTGPICTKCHGTEIAPEVAAKLDELYPNDQARGFRPGDIRGAFTITQPME